MQRSKLESLEDQEIIELDVVSMETPEFPSEASDFPIEDGTAITDHISLRPIVVLLNGVVAGEGAADKIATIRRWRNDRHRLRYVGRNIFGNYVITSLRTEHDARVGDGFRFRLELVQVRIVKPAIVEIVKVDPVKIVPTAVDPTPSPPPAGTQATSTQVKKEDDKGRDTTREIDRDLTYAPSSPALEHQSSSYWWKHPGEREPKYEWKGPGER